MSAANKFLKVKLSTTELEHNHRGCSTQASHDLNTNTENTNFTFANLQRHSSLVSADKFLIKDTFHTSDEDSSSEDDVFSIEKTTKMIVKKTDMVRPSVAKLRANKIAQQQNAPHVKRRTNYSLSNTSNYNLRSNSVNVQKNPQNPSFKLQLVPN